MASRITILVAFSLCVAGCMHAVTYGVDAGARWHVTPHQLDVK